MKDETAGCLLILVPILAYLFVVGLIFVFLVIFGDDIVKALTEAYNSLVRDFGNPK